MELTQEHFDKAVAQLATSEELMALKDDVSAIRTLARFERALKQVGDHLGLTLEL
jgi:hypothetical protein